MSRNEDTNKIPNLTSMESDALQMIKDSIEADGHAVGIKNSMTHRQALIGGYKITPSPTNRMFIHISPACGKSYPC